MQKLFKELLFIRYNKGRSIYFFYWLFKFARSVVVKSRSAFLFPDLHKQKTDRHERLFTSACLPFYFFTLLPLKD